ncbi:hypothetical protein PFTANZ_02351 [Plasmodium falciparum Tanzania (2000708)]|uniref:Rifin n=3 Tax=Plasmodium falciparum TaxID=5833 RepID=A0A024WA37_PLAFA|nr:hypothetical protein PFTANZ_02351 [Plasmodium falciparum Tanzania (2000708)]ETW62138.1 hypothetical protein PFMC_02239 [Plasmodium falciparum CAMP/Malaysia]
MFHTNSYLTSISISHIFSKPLENYMCCTLATTISIHILILFTTINMMLVNTPLDATYTKTKKSHILLCKCDLYMSNYDNDSEMKEVMQNFNKETEQRFYEYDKHMIKNRQKCKDQCDKEIQQIIFKMQN